MGCAITLLATLSAAGATPSAIDELRAALGREAAAPMSIVAKACCKRCSKGKPCGNSCISKKYTCHKGVGCAC